MKFKLANRGTGWLGAVLSGALLPQHANSGRAGDPVQPAPAEPAIGRQVGQAFRQGLAVLLSALMIMIPMGQSTAFAQEPLPGVAPLEEQQDQQTAPASGRSHCSRASCSPMRSAWGRRYRWRPRRWLPACWATARR